MSQPHTDLLDRMSDHVLIHGLNQATLRPLARAAGTSDRMLIYHFKSKEGVITALLDHLSQRFTAVLDAAVLAPSLSASDLIEGIVALMTSPAGMPFARVWLDVVAGAAGGGAAHADAALRILGHFHGWLADRLPPEPGSAADPADRAAVALAVIEGLLVLRAAGAKGQWLVDAALAGFRRADAALP